MRNLLDATVVKNAVDRYMYRTNDYNIFLRLDTTLFTPTFNAATNTIDVFKQNEQAITFTLEEVTECQSVGEVLQNFYKIGICHNFCFQMIGCDYLAYYFAALKHFPLPYIDNLISFNRTAPVSPRRKIWNDLWKMEYKSILAFHPAIFLAMNRYKGPIPTFLQEVTSFMHTTMPHGILHDIYINFICQEWKMPAPFSPRFISLWHQVMTETSVAYLPMKKHVKIDDTVYSSIRFSKQIICYMCNSDKYLCLLLVLFNKPYRQKLNEILVHEPLAPVLANIFAQYQSLNAY